MNSKNREDSNPVTNKLDLRKIHMPCLPNSRMYPLFQPTGDIQTSHVLTLLGRTPPLADVGSGVRWGAGAVCGLKCLCCVSSDISELSSCPHVLSSDKQVHCWLGMGEEMGWKHP